MSVWYFRHAGDCRTDGPEADPRTCAPECGWVVLGEVISIEAEVDASGYARRPLTAVELAGWQPFGKIRPVPDSPPGSLRDFQLRYGDPPGG